MSYEVVDTEDVPITDLSEIDSLPPDLKIRDIDAAVGLTNFNVKLWYFEPGDEIQYHAHSEQEELYYVIQGEFSLKLGDPDEAEIVKVGAGKFWAAKPEVGHGHRCIGDEEGIILALGAPNVPDPGKDPHSIEKEE
ncbi:MAG: cupin domain-containing protein [Halobacteria archaeon]